MRVLAVLENCDLPLGKGDGKRGRLRVLYYYDGEKIIDNVPSLGFILGDEGSGGYFGRKLLQAYYYREMPDDLKKSIEALRVLVWRARRACSAANEYVLGRRLLA